MQDTYVGSQPIYNKELAIYAYQLLFRNNDENNASFSDGDQATSEVRSEERRVGKVCRL